MSCRPITIRCLPSSSSMPRIASAALARLSRALRELGIEGVGDHRGLHRSLARSAEVPPARVDTGFIERLLAEAPPAGRRDPEGMIMSAVRYSFGGDEHVFVELSEEMSLEAFFKGMAICASPAPRGEGGRGDLPGQRLLPHPLRSRCDPSGGRCCARCRRSRRRWARPISSSRRASSRSRCSTTTPGRARP